MVSNDLLLLLALFSSVILDSGAVVAAIWQRSESLSRSNWRGTRVRRCAAVAAAIILLLGSAR